MQCNKVLHILSSERNKIKCANGLRVILDRLTNDTVVEWRIRIQIVDVVEVRSSYQVAEAGC